METDGMLIEQSVRGRPEAFVEVVRRHEVCVHGYLARRAGRDAADDLLADVWVRAFGARGGYDPAYSDALPWLYRIGLPAGAWADRLPSRSLMVTCDLLATVLYASLPAAAWFHVLTIGQLLAVALLAGAVNVIFATAYQVFLPALVQQRDLTEGNAKLQGSASVALIGGRSVAGLAAEGLGTAAAVLCNAASGYSAIVVVFLVRVAGFGSAAVGLLLGTGGIGGVAGALTARRLAARLGSARALQLSALVTGMLGPLIPMTRTGLSLAWYVADSLMLSGGMLVGNIIAGAFRQAYCPPEMLGRVVAGMRFLAFGAIPVGALLAGALGTAVGIRNALWALLAANALTGVILLGPALRSDRDLPASARRSAASGDDSQGVER